MTATAEAKPLPEGYSVENWDTPKRAELTAKWNEWFAYAKRFLPADEPLEGYWVLECISTDIYDEFNHPQYFPKRALPSNDLAANRFLRACTDDPEVCIRMCRVPDDDQSKWKYATNRVRHSEMESRDAEVRDWLRRTVQEILV